MSFDWFSDDNLVNVEIVAVVENVPEITNGNFVSTEQNAELFNGEDGDIIDMCKINNNDIMKQNIDESVKLALKPVCKITEENGKAEKQKAKTLSSGKIKKRKSSKKRSVETAPIEFNACFKDDNCTSGESENESNALCADAEIAAKVIQIN